MLPACKKHPNLRPTLTPPTMHHLHTRPSQSDRHPYIVLEAHVEYHLQQELHLARHPYPPPPPLHSSSSLIHNHVEYLRQWELHRERHSFPHPTPLPQEGETPCTPPPTCTARRWSATLPAASLPFPTREGGGHRRIPPNLYRPEDRDVATPSASYQGPNCRGPCRGQCPPTAEVRPQGPAAGSRCPPSFPSMPRLMPANKVPLAGDHAGVKAHQLPRSRLKVLRQVPQYTPNHGQGSGTRSCSTPTSRCSATPCPTPSKPPPTRAPTARSRASSTSRSSPYSLHLVCRRLQRSHLPGALLRSWHTALLPYTWPNAWSGLHSYILLKPKRSGLLHSYPTPLLLPASRPHLPGAMPWSRHVAWPIARSAFRPYVKAQHLGLPHPYLLRYSLLVAEGLTKVDALIPPATAAKLPAQGHTAHQRRLCVLPTHGVPATVPVTYLWPPLPEDQEVPACNATCVVPPTLLYPPAYARVATPAGAVPRLGYAV